MILRQFPDLTWLKNQAEQRFANRQRWGGGALTENGWPTVILNTHAGETFRDNIRGPLSLFLNISGTSTVQVDGKRTAVSEDCFFISNADQHYTLEIDKHASAETFNIHFGEHFAENVLNGLTQTHGQLLDNNETNGHDTMAFFNKLYPRDPVFNAIVNDLKTSSDSLFHDEKLADLLSHLILQQRGIRKTYEAIPALKSSTRQEIVRRLFHTTDYIYTHYYRNLTLEELARESCLSKFHFLRLFKIAFGQSPYQFINSLRVAKAKELLLRGKQEVRTIATSLGFDNPSSFSRMFYQHTGVYPSQFR